MTPKTPTDQEKSKTKATPFRKAQGRLIGAALKRRGLTQQEVERATGIKQSHISAVKRGEKGLSNERLKKLADCLGVTLDDLTPKDVPKGPDDELYADDVGPVQGSIAISKPHSWPPPDGSQWPQGLKEFLERHGERLKINRHERWKLYQFRTRREDWQKPQDDDYWADALDWYRMRDEKERDAN